MLVHGHHHERYDAIIDGGIRVVGVGLLGTPDMQTWMDEGLYWLDPETLQHKLIKGPGFKP
jgi:hypothetical protein